MTTDYETERAEVPDTYRGRFMRGYAEAILDYNSREYSSPQDDGRPVNASEWQNGADDDWALSAFTDQSRAMISGDCDDFMSAQWEHLRGVDPGRSGADFALTRNGHGDGFWDRGLGEKGDKLTEAAHVYGESSGWVTADGDRVCLFDEPAVITSDGEIREPDCELEAG